MKTVFGALIVACASLAAPNLAGASELITRNATGVKLQVDSRGQALITYKVAGQTRHVLASGAVNARRPSRGRPQVKFKLDYSASPKGFRNACSPLSQVVQWQVTACQASDGSYWALQAWQRALPNYGLTPNARQAVWELRLSHWTGDVAKLTVAVDWAYGKFDHLFGTFTYQGGGVHGFRSTSTGVPLDTYGRNLYLDTLDSAYGPGWQRENSFLAHGPGGTFCYTFVKHGARPAGNGRRYRITVIGPGVTPDVYWEGAAPGPFDPTKEQDAAGLQRALIGRDPACPPR